jgi:hypothetical protein
LYHSSRALARRAASSDSWGQTLGAIPIDKSAAAPRQSSLLESMHASNRLSKKQSHPVRSRRGISDCYRDPKETSSLHALGTHAISTERWMRSPLRPRGVIEVLPPRHVNLENLVVTPKGGIADDDPHRLTASQRPVT